MRHSTRALLGFLVVCCCRCTMGQESRPGWWWPFGAKDRALEASAPTTVPPTTATAPPTTSTKSPFAGSAALPPSNAVTPGGPQPGLPTRASLAQAPAESQPLTATRTTTTAQAAVGQYQASTTVQADRPPIIESPFPKFTWPKVQMPEMPQFWPNREQADATRNAWVGKSAETEQPSPLESVRVGARRVGESTRAAWRKTVDTLTPGEPIQHNTGSRIAQREIKPPFWKRMFGSEQAEPQGPQTIPQWMAQDRLDP